MPGGPGHLALRLAASAVVLTLSLAAIGVPPRDSLTQCTGDKDVRNKPSNLLETLKNCVVVEGNLTVVLMEGPEEHFEGLSFPELREVTGFVLFYRVSGLTSLGKLFPNLALIRGNQLFNNMYALVVFDMPHLQELGLTSLQLIQRGTVRIQRNPELCLADALDWDVLAPDPEFLAERNISDNKWVGECARCSCPLCWGPVACRRPAAMLSPAPQRRPCHRNCAVGCKGTSSQDCHRCLGPEVNGDCVDKCPAGTLLFRGRRCVSLDDCEAQRADGARGFEFRGECIHFCPPGHRKVREQVEESELRNHPRRRYRRTCKLCQGPCPKSCNGAIIRTVKDALNLKTCTVVNGTVEIEIESGEDMEEKLEPSLGSIQVITGSLIVSRSRALSSLHFLRSLRAVHGDDTNKKQTIFINDNANLQSLFDWRGGEQPFSLRLGQNAHVAFYYNPRLCPQEIEKFVAATNVSSDHMLDNLNGFINPCGTKNLTSVAAVLGPETVVLTWGAWEPAEELVGYAVFFRAAARRDVAEYAAGSNLCQLDGDGDGEHDWVGGWAPGWTAVDVRFSKGESEVNQIVPRLRPAQLYAYYIKTYTTRANLNSPIRYFRTRADRPTPPASARAAAVRWAPGTLLVAWEPPPRPNGPISHYVVTGELRDDDDRRQLADRDFCAFPATAAAGSLEALTADAARDWLRSTPSIAPSTASAPSGCCCVPLDEDECERLLRGARDIRDACGQRVDSLDHCTHVLQTVMAEHIRDAEPLANPGEFPRYRKAPVERRIDLSEQWDWEGTKRRRFVRVEGGAATSSLVSSLVPFGLYSVSVHACGQREILADDGEPPGNYSSLVAFCSAETVTAARTLPAADADAVRAANATLEADGQPDDQLDVGVLVSWGEPPRPNGLVVAYHVRLRYRDRQRGLQIEHCVSQQSYQQSRGRVRVSLNASAHSTAEEPQPLGIALANASLTGRLAVQVRAVTLAGPGSWVDVEVLAPSAVPPSVTTAPSASAPATTTPRAGEDAHAAHAEVNADALSPRARAAAVVVVLLLALGLLSAGLFVLRRRAERDGDGLSRRLLVSSDLTDCWDLPEESFEAEEVDWPGGARSVRYRKDSEADHVSIVPWVRFQVPTDTKGAAQATRWVQQADDTPAPPARPWSRGSGDNAALPGQDACAPQPSHPAGSCLGSSPSQRWHPTNPFHPDNLKQEEAFTCERAESVPGAFPSRNPFRHDGLEEGSPDSTRQTTPIESRIFPGSRQRQNSDFDTCARLSVPLQIKESSSDLERKFENVEDKNDETLTEQLPRSSSADSFTSVNLDEFVSDKRFLLP